MQIRTSRWNAGGRGRRSALQTFLTLLALVAALIWLQETSTALSGAPRLLRSAQAAPPPDGNYVVYVSESTAAHFRAVGGNYEVLITPWRKYFLARNMSVAFTRDLKALEGRAKSTLILPSAVSLTADERAKILSFYNRGGSILATWATGSWAGPGKWAGWDLIKSLGGNPLGETTTKDGEFLIFRGETPVTFNITAGERISLSPSEENILVYKPDASSAARLVDWARLTAPVIQDKNSVVQFKEAARTQGRVVLFGFSENSWPAAAVDIYPLVDDSLNWLMRRPAIVLAAWPDAYPSAHVLEMDTEDGFATAENLSVMAKSKNIPVSFFVLSSVATQFPELLRRLNADHEIGLHGDVHDGFRGQSAPTQFKRIRTAQTDIDRLLGSSANRVGFRPPREEYDKATEAVLLDNGMLYQVIDPNSTSGRLPFFTKKGETDASRSLIALPRTQRDDLNLLAATQDPVALEKSMIEDLNVITENGGLAVLSIHSQNFDIDAPLARALPPYLAYVNTMRKKTWVTDTGSVARWWRDRSRVTLSSDVKGGVVDVSLTVSGTTPVDGLSLIAMTPERGVAPKISKPQTGSPKPTIDMMDPLRYRIQIPSLAPGKYSYQLTF